MGHYLPDRFLFDFRGAALATFVSLCLAAPGTSVRGEQITERAVAATFKIANSKSTATGFLLSRPRAAGEKPEVILATAAHVLTSSEGDTAELILRRETEGGKFERAPLTLKIRAGGTPRWVAHPKEDVAVMRIELPPFAEGAPLPVDCLATEEWLKEKKVGPGDGVHIFCFPAQVEANGAGFPIVRQGCIAGYPLTPVDAHRTFPVDYNGFAGDSGGPVILAPPQTAATREAGAGLPVIAGVVFSQHFQDEKSVGEYEERKTRHRLSLVHVVHAEFIRQTLELLK